MMLLNIGSKIYWVCNKNLFWNWGSVFFIRLYSESLSNKVYYYIDIF